MVTPQPIYAVSAEKHWARGWRGILPLPPQKKKDPPAGFTGYEGIDPSYADILQWIETRPADSNSCLRLHEGITGIDVDHYGGKFGGLTLEEAKKLWGKLPYSPRSTSRVGDPISGIRLYRTPPGLKFKTVLEFPELGYGAVEIIQRHHRYVMCWPSIHDITGQTYRWIDDDGNEVEIPRPEDLPELPAKWIGGLYAPSGGSVGDDLESCDVAATLTDGEPEGRVEWRLKKAIEDLDGGSRFDHTRDSVLALLRFGKDGDPGVAQAIDTLRDEYVSAVTLDGSRPHATAVNEFNRLITNPGAAKLLAQPSYPDLFAPADHKPEESTMSQPNTSAEAAEPTDEPTFAAFAGSAEASEPIPLTHNTVEIPPFPVESYPATIATKIRELAEATQTDPAMAATSALSVLAACCGGHAEIEVRSGWREPLCLFTGTIARPGERKSAVQSSMIGPLNHAESELSLAGQIERLKREDELELARRTAEKLRTAAAAAAAIAAKAGATEDQKTAAKEAKEAALAAAEVEREITVPNVPRLLADDVTPEATGSLLAENGGRIAIISAEGGIFDTIAGRYARAVNLDVFLKGHAGDPIRVDRKGRPPEYVAKPALTVGLMFQPRILEAIAANRDFTGRGLLARFLYARPVSKVGSRTIGAKPVGRQTEVNYNELITKLASEMAGWVGDPAVLTLTPEAEQALKTVETEIEPMLADGGDLASLPTLTEWGSKYCGAVARIAGLLHLAKEGAAGVRIPVQADTVEAAARIGDYFRAAAVSVFSEMNCDEATADAAYLLDRVEYLNADVVSERELFTAASRSRFPTVKAMKPALRRLVEHGYLTPLPAPTLPTGGRPASPTYKVNAHLRESRESRRRSA